MRHTKPLTRRDFKGNIYRHLLADAIERNCGYSSGYHDRFALSWDVSLDSGVMDSDKVLAKVFEHDYAPSRREQFDADVPPERLAAWAAQWDEEANLNDIWEQVRDDMARSVTEDAAYSSISSETANRYGLSYSVWPRKFARLTAKDTAFYPAEKAGWKIVEPYSGDMAFDVKFELHGRGGKHLCLTEFEGSSLAFSANEFADSIRSDSSGDFADSWCQKLLAFIHECDHMFDHKVVRSEFEYQTLYRAAQELEELCDECVAAKREAAERLYWAERDVETV